MKHIEALISALKLSPINPDSLYSGKRDLTPLAAVELFLEEQQRLVDLLRLVRSYREILEQETALLNRIKNSLMEDVIRE